MPNDRKKNLLIDSVFLNCYFYPFQMISVQSPGYAGMERFGVDVGLGSPPNHR